MSGNSHKSKGLRTLEVLAAENPPVEANRIKTIQSKSGPYRRMRDAVITKVARLESGGARNDFDDLVGDRGLTHAIHVQGKRVN